ncbi:MAG: hypothetical protein E6K77_03720 [Candidatus Eisenbacteria bacterium]|uniref:Uncharacterized protein n=1 Tax=Eiseniibacteriota bacterium TaxID=2212470 RepID=A0A538TLS1_UNCEI|nr:MAG: hypothetical protein E6K77_03720 [Candidatus Eisenbacteria bacterium]
MPFGSFILGPGSRVLRRALRAGLGAAISLVAAGSADASFKSFLPGGDGAAFPSSADGRTTATPSVNAYHLADGDHIKLDGHLDDPAWDRAEAASGFKVWEPDRGTIPSEETVFKVVYDESAIYFGVACHEKDPSKVTARLSRRDRFSNSDIVSVYIDPYLDHTTGYNFKVNPLGVLLDGYMYNDGDRDDNWDAVWDAQTYRDQDGWYVEMRIPFSAIRYRTAESMTWGLEVYRYMHGRGEDTAWVTWDRAAKGFVSRWGQLTGIQGVPAPRQLEIVPYVVGRATDPSQVGNEKLDKFENMGADLKYGVTADLALNATVQPDFGQVEADPAVLNLSPFETFYEEKRPFFIEGSRLFQHPDFNLFYSRRIGTGDPNSRIRYAGKLTGKAAGNVTIATLVASSDVTGRGQAHNLLKNGGRLSRYFVTRLGKEFRRRLRSLLEGPYLQHPGIGRRVGHRPRELRRGSHRRRGQALRDRRVTRHPQGRGQVAHGLERPLGIGQARHQRRRLPRVPGRDRDERVRDAYLQPGGQEQDLEPGELQPQLLEKLPLRGTQGIRRKHGAGGLVLWPRAQAVDGRRSE